MKKLWSMLVLALVALTASAQYQLTNPGFEEWETVSYNNYTGEEPIQWSSFLTATGSYKGTIGREQLFKAEVVRPGSAGKYSAQLTARKVLGNIYAQGNMTSGCINGSSMSASDGSGNYNYTNEEDESQCMPFSGRPDAMRVWVNAYTTAGNQTANVSVYLHEKGYYQDPNTANTDRLAPLVAHGGATPAAAAGAEYNAEGWQEVIIPLEYYRQSRPYYALVSFSTNSVPGQGTAGDYMYVDDVEMLYYSELATATYNGKPVTLTDGRGQVNSVYNQKLLVLKATGAGAAIETEIDPETFLLKITVKGDNISEDPMNFHTYEIQFTDISGGADDEYDAVITPGSTTVTPAPLVSGQAYYLYNVAQKGYLASNDQLSNAPQAIWTINTNDGTIIDADGHYVRIDRIADNLTSLEYSNFPVSSSNTAWDSGLNLTFETETDGIRFCRKNMNAYKGGFLNLQWRQADIYAGAASMTELTACSATDDNGKWQLVTEDDYQRTLFWQNYASASLSHGVKVTGFYTSGEETTVNGLPLGVYEFGQSGKFYLPAGEDLTITEAQSNQVLTYYGRLDFSLNATYDGKTIKNNEVDAYYDAEKPLTVKLGNGAENYLSVFDADRGILTVIISGYGRSREHEIQFAVPELTLVAEWYGEALEDGASIDEAYDAEHLTLVSGAGTSYEATYDGETGVLSVIVTSAYGQTRTYTFQFAVYAEVLGTYNYDNAALVAQYRNSIPDVQPTATATVELLADGKANFLLNNFTATNKQGELLDFGTLAMRGVECKGGRMNFSGRVRTAEGTLLPVSLDAIQLFPDNGTGDTELMAAVTVMLDSVQVDYFYNIQTYKEYQFVGDIHVSINGENAGTERTMVVVDHLNNGNINFSLADFSLAEVGKVGSINILNKAYDAETGKFGFKGDLFIAPGTTGEPEEWMGPGLGAIPVTLEGQIINNALTVIINIDLRKQLDQIVSVVFTTEYLVGIASVESDRQGVSSAIYDLSGRRVSRPAKGIYVINGRKVVR